MGVKKLGFGLMRLPLLDKNDDTGIDIEQAKKMVDMFIERGFTYFDTAWMYHGFKSEEAVKEILTTRYPRHSYTLATKLHVHYVKSMEERDGIFNEQLRKTGVEYFDYYLLHNVNEKCYEDLNKFDCFTWLREKKAAGLAKHIGCSSHSSPEFLEKLLAEHPELEFVQLQLNYLDWESERVRARECYETVVKHGKKVIVMEPVRGGALANIPAEAEAMFKAAQPEKSVASWAIRFAAGLDSVMMVLSGMSSLQQMEDNTGFMENFEPMSGEETELCHRAREIINKSKQISCTACSYCTDGCPMNIAIPSYFVIYNENVKEDGARKQQRRDEYRSLTEKFGKAGDCIGCAQCEGICPQGLPIIELLKKVAKDFEEK